ncbi:MAG: hypothetical protein WC650_03990 [Candidatus Doudnabacteria bacterium]
MSITMKEARELIVQAEREINRLDEIQNDPQATRMECDLREGVGNLKSDLCHDSDPISGGKLDDISNEWVLIGDAVKSYELLKRIKALAKL